LLPSVRLQATSRRKYAVGPCPKSCLALNGLEATSNPGLVADLRQRPCMGLFWQIFVLRAQRIRSLSTARPRPREESVVCTLTAHGESRESGATSVVNRAEFRLVIGEMAEPPKPGQWYFSSIPPRPDREAEFPPRPSTAATFWAECIFDIAAVSTNSILMFLSISTRSSDANSLNVSNRYGTSSEIG